MHLTNIAPAVFEPSLPQFLNSRQAFIPAIAQCLAMFDTRSARIESYEEGDIDTAITSSNHQGYMEEYLWSCMLSVPPVTSRAPENSRHRKNNYAVQNWPSRFRHKRDDSNTLANFSTKHSLTKQDSSLIDVTGDGFEETINQDEMMLEDFEITTLDVCGQFSEQYVLPCTSTISPHFHPTENNAMTRAHSQFVDEFNDKRSLSTLAMVGSVLRLDDYACQPLTHIDKNGIESSSFVASGDRQNLIGQKWLTHDAYSTQPNGAKGFENPSEDMIEIDDKPYLLMCTSNVSSSPPLINW